MADQSQQYAQLIQQSQQIQQQAQFNLTQQSQQHQLQQQQLQQQQQQGGAGTFAATSAHPPQAQAVQSQLQAAIHGGVPGNTVTTNGLAANGQFLPANTQQDSAQTNLMLRQLVLQTNAQAHNQQQQLQQQQLQQQLQQQTQKQLQNSQTQMQQQYAQHPQLQTNTIQQQQIQMQQARQALAQTTVMPLAHTQHTASTIAAGLTMTAPTAGAASLPIHIQQQQQQMAFAVQQQALRNGTQAHARQQQQALQQRTGVIAATSLHSPSPALRPMTTPHTLQQQQQFHISRANPLTAGITHPPGSVAALQHRQFPASYTPTTPSLSSTPVVAHAPLLQPLSAPPVVPAQPIVLSADDRRSVSLRGLALAMRHAGLDKGYVLDEPTQTALLAIYDDLLDSAIEFGCMMAKKRKVGAGNPMLQARDMAQHLSRGYGLSIPGFGGDMLKPYKRRTGSSEIHRARMAAVRLTAQKLEEGGSEPATAAVVSKTTAAPGAAAAAAAATAGAAVAAVGGSVAAESQPAGKTLQSGVAGAAAEGVMTKPGSGAATGS